MTGVGWFPTAVLQLDLCASHNTLISVTFYGCWHEVCCSYRWNDSPNLPTPICSLSFSISISPSSGFSPFYSLSLPLALFLFSLFLYNSLLWIFSFLLSVCHFISLSFCSFFLSFCLSLPRPIVQPYRLSGSGYGSYVCVWSSTWKTTRPSSRYAKLFLLLNYVLSYTTTYPL